MKEVEGEPESVPGGSGIKRTAVAETIWYRDEPHGIVGASGEEQP